ncbi:MAG: hypothetical protein V3U54_13400 [Thermodesulfobacteriota bacterium]
MVVRKRAINLLITGGVIVGVILIAQRFGIGGRIVEGFGGLAGTLTQGPLEFIRVFAEGAGQIGTEAIRISENFQRALAGGLLLSEQEIFGGGGFPGGTITEQTVTTQPGQVFPEFLRSAFQVFAPQPTPTTPDRPAGQSIFDVARAFTRQAQESRIALVTTAAGLPGTTAFGGFGGALEQEAALQKAIAEARERFSQFFKV